MDTVTIEHTFEVPADDLWKVLTDEKELRKWYFCVSGFKPEKGYEFSFTGEGHKGEKYIHLCRVTEVIPAKRIQYSWEYEKIQGSTLVTFDLSEEGEKTKLKLTHTGLETLPAGNPDFAKESFEAGWTEIITKSLPGYLSGRNQDRK